jgi:hypothetical protein
VVYVKKIFRFAAVVAPNQIVKSIFDIVISSVIIVSGILVYIEYQKNLQKNYPEIPQWIPLPSCIEEF